MYWLYLDAITEANILPASLSDIPGDCLGGPFYGGGSSFVLAPFPANGI